jgi:hypothetical protein
MQQLLFIFRFGYLSFALTTISLQFFGSWQPFYIYSFSENITLEPYFLFFGEEVLDVGIRETTNVSGLTQLQTTKYFFGNKKKITQ